MSAQATVPDLLLDSRRDLGLTYLFISRDLSEMKRLADHVAITHRGRIVGGRVNHAGLRLASACLYAVLAERRTMYRPPAATYTAAWCSARFRRGAVV